MKNNIVFGCVCIIAAALFVICAGKLFGGDDEAPTITIGSELIEYKDSYDKKTLLSDVTAYDKQDGDVTSSVIVKSIVKLTKGDKVKITYAAKDSRNNVATESRVLPVNSSNKETTKDTEETTSGEETTSTEETTSDEETTSVEETTTVEETTAVTDNSVPETINTAEVDKTGVPAIALKETEFTIKVGGEFNLLNHIAKTYDDKGDVSRRVQVSGDYDVKVVGDYTLNYYVTDQDGNTSKKQQLILHVRAK